jgi:hypothetical protein
MFSFILKSIVSVTAEFLPQEKIKKAVRLAAPRMQASRTPPSLPWKPVLPSSGC